MNNKNINSVKKKCVSFYAIGESLNFLLWHQVLWLDENWNYVAYKIRESLWLVENWSRSEFFSRVEVWETLLWHWWCVSAGDDPSSRSDSLWLLGRGDCLLFLHFPVNIYNKHKLQDRSPQKSNTWENTTQKSSLIVLTHNIWKQTCEVRRVGEFLIGTDRGVGGSWGVGGLICQRRLWIWHHAFVISVSSAPLGRLSKLNEGKINIKILTIIF